MGSAQSSGHRGREERLLLRIDTGGSNVAFSPDGQWLATGDGTGLVTRTVTGNGQIEILQLPEGRVVQRYQLHEGSIYDVAFSPDGRLLASASEDKTIGLSHFADGKPVRTLTGHTERVYSVVFSFDGKLLASASQDRTIKLWEVNTGLLIRSLPCAEGGMDSVVFSPSGQLVACGGYVWRVADGQLVKTILTDEGGGWLVAFSSDDQWLATAAYGENTIALWQVDSGRKARSWVAHTRKLQSLCFHPQSPLLVSSGLDNTIKFWQIPEGRLTHILPGHGVLPNATFSPSGQLLAVTCALHGGKIEIWQELISKFHLGKP